MSLVEVGGLSLNVERAGDGPPVVLLHGFTGSSGTWSGLAAGLPEYTTLAIDIVGHGASDAPAGLDRYAMRRAVDDLVDAVRECGHDRATWLGYSMGGRTALQVAAHRPDAVAALVLESASPGLGSEADRAARRAADEELADRIERDGVESFVDYWERLPLWDSQRSLAPEQREALREQRLANRPEGLANSLRGMGTGAQEALHDRLSALEVPVLLLTGSLDARYGAIAAEMVEALPDGRMRVIDGAGHAAHLERPAEFNAAVREFLHEAHRAGAPDDD
jgi:2-succinyl-6-hydroxy-2,4-cyclohexadiene-1-carboxylate synthase